MKKQDYIFITLAGLLTAGLCSACSDDFLGNSSSSSDYMAFKVTMSDGNNRASRSAHKRTFDRRLVRMPMGSKGDSLYLHPIVSDFDDAATTRNSRSAMVNSADEMYETFYVSAYQYDDTWDAAHGKQTPNYFVSEQAVKSGSIYAMSPVRYWPEDGKMRFVAHGPVDDDAFTFSGNDATGNGPKVHIKIADKVADQNDLVVSYSGEIACKGNATSTAGLNFKHALTGIRFVCDNTLPKGVITNITFKGVRYEGDFYYNVASTQSSTSDITIDSNFSALEVYDKDFSLDLNYSITGENNQQITDGENTFLMFPQTLPEGASVEITIEHVDANGNPNGNSDVIVGDLGSRVWPAGKIVTYKISTSDQILEVDEPATFDYLGKVYDSSSSSWLSNNSINVSSFAGEKNMKWKVEYKDEGSTTWLSTSSWLSIDPSFSWQDEADQTVPFVAKSTYNSIDIDKNLKAAASVGSSTSPYNLANATGASAVQNTANSYIVSAPGYYMLPLVYGNGITNSAVNSAAYISSASGSNVLTNFKNHLNASITAPYIADNAGCVPDHAGIVWQDVQNLVQNVQYVASAYGGKGGIMFYVSPSTIAQGNAVISISDKNNVMWSWHIWATSFKGFDSTVDVTNQDGNTFTLMPLNLGWCSNGEVIRYYPKRSCTVRFTPTEGNTELSQEVTFVQESHTSIPFGNNPYYQWGRKDPFVGSNIAWGNKERWDGNGTYYAQWSDYNPPRLFSDLVEDTSSDRLTTKQCLDMLIKNPDKWHNPPAKVGGSSYVSLNETYSNLWGENTMNADVKTVYDPCPPGYQVNYFYTYTGFLSAGYDWTSDKGINFVDNVASDWDGSNLAEFYTDNTKLHSITFPVCGYRDWNDKASVVDFKVRGFVWMRGLSDDLNAYMLRYAAHTAGVANVAPVTMFYSTDGLPIRPALIN